MIDSILNTARDGMMQSLNRIEKDAVGVASGYHENSTADPVQSAVNLSIDSNSYDANAHVVKTAQQLSKSVLDLLA